MQSQVVRGFRSATLLYKQMHTLTRVAPISTYRPTIMVNTPVRTFFGGKKTEEKSEKTTQDSEEKEADKNAADKDSKKKESSGSSSDSSGDEAELSKDDVKKVKALFQEQEVEIKSLQK